MTIWELLDRHWDPMTLGALAVLIGVFTLWRPIKVEITNDLSHANSTSSSLVDEGEQDDE